MSKHAASAGSTARTGRARWMAAPPAHAVVALHIAGNTVAESEKERTIDATHAPLPRARHLRRMIVLSSLHQILHRASIRKIVLCMVGQRANADGPLIAFCRQLNCSLKWVGEKEWSITDKIPNNNKGGTRPSRRIILIDFVYTNKTINHRVAQRLAIRAGL